MKQKIYTMLGFAQRAGKVMSGEKGCESNIKKGKAKLLILAEDASENTRKNFIDMCRYNEVPYQIIGRKTELGLAIGKSQRSTLVILDQGFVEAIQKLLPEENRSPSL